MSTGRWLGSVALRYRQPICAAGGLRPVPRGGCRGLFPGQRALGLPMPVPVESLAGPGGEMSADGGSGARSGATARLEAVLLLARGPEGSRRLAELAGLADGTEARTLVRRLNGMYDARGCAFRVEEVAGGFQLMSRPKFAPWLRRLHDARVETRLSTPAMETLAVVAYRQPVLRAEVEAIRGVQSGEILRQLIERGLVRIVGRSEELGRPLLYGTTRGFLEAFGLRHLEELPRRELLQGARPAPAHTIEPDVAQAGQERLPQANHSHQVEEETKVNTAAIATTHPEDLPDEDTATVAQAAGSELPRDGQLLDEDDFDEDDFDDVEDDDEDDYEEDEEDDYEEDDLEEDDLDEDDDDEDDDDEDDDKEFEEGTWVEVEEEDEDEEEEYDEEDWDDDDWEDEDDEEDEEEDEDDD